RKSRRSSSGIPGRLVSVVTGQAVLGRAVLSVAIDAPAHLELLRRQEPRPPVRVGSEMDLVHVLHRPVAALAVDAGLEVAVVPELHVLGQTVDLHPGNRLLALPVLLQRPDPRELVVGRREEGVAAHARLDRGDTGGGRAVGAAVAVLAVDAVEARVVLVTERDRLE